MTTPAFVYTNPWLVEFRSWRPSRLRYELLSFRWKLWRRLFMLDSFHATRCRLSGSGCMSWPLLWVSIFCLSVMPLESLREVLTVVDTNSFAVKMEPLATLHTTPDALSSTPAVSELVAETHKHASQSSWHLEHLTPMPLDPDKESKLSVTSCSPEWRTGLCWDVETSETTYPQLPGVSSTLSFSHLDDPSTSRPLKYSFSPECGLLVNKLLSVWPTDIHPRSTNTVEGISSPPPPPCLLI